MKDTWWGEDDGWEWECYNNASEEKERSVSAVIRRNASAPGCQLEKCFSERLSLILLYVGRF